jgi:hypothetical protein
MCREFATIWAPARVLALGYAVGREDEGEGKA